MLGRSGGFSGEVVGCRQAGPGKLNWGKKISFSDKDKSSSSSSSNSSNNRVAVAAVIGGAGGGEGRGGEGGEGRGGEGGGEGAEEKKGREKNGEKRAGKPCNSTSSSTPVLPASFANLRSCQDAWQ